MKMLSMFRRSALALGLAFCALNSQAAAPAQKTQVPGYYRYADGAFEVTAIYDGSADLDIQLLKGMKADQIQELLARMFVEPRTVLQTAVNAYLVNTGDHLVLVDAGAGNCLGPTMGHLPENLRAAGYKPEDVDTLLVTHLDPDHVCGVVGRDGKAAFPNATLWVGQEDVDFRFNEKIAAAAPEGVRPFFQMAINAVKPYQDAGKFHAFKVGDKLFPGVTIIPTHGHTPGQAAYLFSSGKQELLVLGDVIHNHAVQFPHPEVAVAYDQDEKQAVATRKMLFERAAKSGWALAGAHLPFPGLGHIRQDGKGYAWVPVEFGPIVSQ